MEKKFRVWFENTMSNDFTIKNNMAMREENPKKSEEIVFENKSFYTDWASYVVKKGAVIMQFTGVEDKNGVEIYEGDIIVAGNGRKYEIKFGEWNFNLDIEPTTINITGIGFSFSGSEPFGECEFGGGVQYEVIGNIYQHAELL